jgi:hypothetical protein
MAERIEKGSGTFHRAKDAPPLGGKRQYELRFIPTYVPAGDVKVEGIPDPKGFIELLDIAGRSREDNARIARPSPRGPAQRSVGYSLQHAAEHQAVDRKEGVPIRAPQQPARIEGCRLPDR